MLTVALIDETEEDSQQLQAIASQLRASCQRKLDAVTAQVLQVARLTSRIVIGPNGMLSVF
jgi:predicted DNA-binding ribbon-helix-helix protein